MALPPTSSPAVSPVVALAVRLLTFLCLLVALTVLATNNTTLAIDFQEAKLRFNDVYAYRYMLATIVIGIAYTLLQTAFTIYQVTTEKRLGGDGLVLFDFYADKCMSYMLATGAAAGFGATEDLKRLFEGAIDKFFNKAIAAATLLFLGFVFSAISSILSSLSLPKRS